MTAERRAERQAQIEGCQAEAAAAYPSQWLKMTGEWRQAGDDRAWLVYAANYLFRTGGVRWALDPLSLRQRVRWAPEANLNRLSGLSFVLLTHRHADHLDYPLIRSLRQHPIRWVIPEAILPLVLERCGLPESQVIIPHPLEALQIEGMRITPFEGLHWERAAVDGGAARGVATLGYLVEWAGKRWLFPGDVRDYDLQKLPDFGQLDGAFAHLWLGRGGALLDQPPLLEPFCAFYAGLPAQRLVVAHLHELGRQAEDYWDDEHYAQVAARLRQLAPERTVQAARMGESLVL